MVTGEAVVALRAEVESSPVLEPADILIGVEARGGALFIVLPEDGALDPEAFVAALPQALQVEVETLATEPFLWVTVGDRATRDEVEAALDEIEEELRWMAGRSVGWSYAW